MPPIEENINPIKTKINQEISGALNLNEKHDDSNKNSKKVFSFIKVFARFGGECNRHKN